MSDKVIKTVMGSASVSPHAMAQLVAQLSNEQIESSIARLETRRQAPGVDSALEFAQAELARRRPIAPVQASAPVVTPDAVSASRPAPAGPIDVDHLAAEEHAAELARAAQALVFEAQEQGRHLDVVDAVRMAREASEGPNPADCAHRLMAEAKARGESLDFADALRIAQLPASHTEVVSLKARQLQASARARGEYLDAADAVRRVRGG
jgi:hypothetical protein